MTPDYQEPILTVVVLDFCKPKESRLCLESIRKHIKFPHKTIFCDNGSQEDYPVQFLKEGLIDQLIINRESTGLGLGTRDLFAASFSPHTLNLQNDQLFGRDFTLEDFSRVTGLIGQKDSEGRSIASVSLAGSPCGVNVYSERAHIIATNFYKQMEAQGILKHYGAGPYHLGRWRESIIQELYRQNNFIHYQSNEQPWVIDNGIFATRDMREGGVWCHRTDTKRLFVIVPPQVKNDAYPKLTDEEYGLAWRGKWPEEGKIPEMEIKDSFECWQNTELAKNQDEYIRDLKERFKKKYVS